MNRQQFILQIESNQRALRRFLMALCCGDAALADDMAQDTFVKAYLSCESIDDERKFAPWIFRIAYNTFVSHRRSFTPHESICAAEQLSGHSYADDAFEYQDLYRALAQLSEKERSAVLLHYMQGYSIKEIAGINDSSVEAVKQQLSRARQHLKDLLK